MNLIPLASFVLITTFTPGPNNISSASLGVAYGYRRTVPFLVGIWAGFFIVMLVCALLSGTLLKMLPTIEYYMKYVGAGYIVWLAWGTLHADYSVKENGRSRGEFRKGFFLQLLNPKVIVYGLTIYSTFLAGLSQRFDILTLSGLFLASIAFVATSSWALFGSAISRFLTDDGFKRIVNIILSVLLIYIALDLAGIV